MAKKGLGSIRVDETIILKMKTAIKKYNSNRKLINPITQSQFIRFAISYLSDLIIQDLVLYSELQRNTK